MMNDTTYTVYKPSTIDQRVKDAVYCWVLVNHPQIIEDAQELVAG